MKTWSLGKIPSGSWNGQCMKDAFASLTQIMQENEEWLLCALLDRSDDWKLFGKTSKQEVWRGRDYLYAFMTEKDIQARLAAELYKFPRCHVHVENSVYVKKNKSGGDKSKSKNRRPDVFLLTTRRKEKRKKKKDKPKEDRLEGSAIEIKYFGRGDTKSKKSLIKDLIMDDMQKLRDYLKSRVQPRADNGFFLCMDESGVASDILAKVMTQKRFKNKRIGYFVLVPDYIRERRDYPLNLEKHQEGLERSSVYVMDKALGMLKKWRPSSFDGEKVKCDKADKYRGSAGPWFCIRAGNQEIGWAELDWKFKHRRRICPALVIELYDESADVGDSRTINWKKELEAYRYSKNHAEAERVYLETSKTYTHDLKKMNLLADEIFRKVKRVAA